MDNLPVKKQEIIIGSNLVTSQPIDSKFHIGDEVEVYVTGEPLTINSGAFYFHKDSKMGVIEDIAIDNEGFICYKVRKYSIGITLEKTIEYIRMETEELYNSMAIREGFINKISFIDLKIHLFNSVIESNKLKTRSIEQTKTLTSNHILEMQKAFYEYGKTGTFPPEWDRLMKSIKEQSPILFNNLL